MTHGCGTKCQKGNGFLSESMQMIAYSIREVDSINAQLIKRSSICIEWFHSDLYFYCGEHTIFLVSVGCAKILAYLHWDYESVMKVKIWILFLNLISSYFSSAYAQNSSSHMSVWQTPQDLKVMEGANAQITCNFDMCSGSSRVTLKWEKDNKTLHSDLIECQSNTNASRVLELKSLSQNQSGLYVCEVSVDIPLLKKGKGTGTNVTVTGKTAVYFFLRQVFGPCIS